MKKLWAPGCSSVEKHLPYRNKPATRILNTQQYAKFIVLSVWLFQHMVQEPQLNVYNSVIAVTYTIVGMVRKEKESDICVNNAFCFILKGVYII